MIIEVKVEQLQIIFQSISNASPEMLKFVTTTFSGHHQPPSARPDVTPGRGSSPGRCREVLLGKEVPGAPPRHREVGPGGDARLRHRLQRHPEQGDRTQTGLDQAWGTKI